MNRNVCVCVCVRAKLLIQMYHTLLYGTKITMFHGPLLRELDLGEIFLLRVAWQLFEALPFRLFYLFENRVYLGRHSNGM